MVVSWRVTNRCLWAAVVTHIVVKSSAVREALRKSVMYFKVVP